MKINPINFYNYKNNSLSFKGNGLKQNKPQVLPENLYFIRMGNYDENKEWANEMNNATYVLSDMIRSNKDFDDIWNKAKDEVLRINKKPAYSCIRNKGGSGFYVTDEINERGREYYSKYKKVIRKASKDYVPKSTQEYKNATRCSIKEYDKIWVIYGSSCYYDYFNLKDNVKKEYEKLKSNPYPKTKEINRSVATIHWLIAQATPFEKGSDSFANLLTKSIYHAYNMKLTPAKTGVSFDFEAFYSDLEDYIKKYPKLFEKPPSRD